MMLSRAKHSTLAKKSSSNSSQPPVFKSQSLFPGMPEMSSQFFGEPASAPRVAAGLSSPKETANGSNGTNGMNTTSANQMSRDLSYDNADLDEITQRQLQEDIAAYNYDLNFCEAQLVADDDITPQETRTLQLRILDLGHQIRHCKHRIELMQAQKRLDSASYRGNIAKKPRASSSGAFPPLVSAKTPISAKRPLEAASANGVSHYSSAKRLKMEASPDDDNDGIEETTEIRRLGMWNCRLCKTDKYKLAGEGRLPSAPCKWPLKDVAKMITHFTDMHGEHDPDERCMELGAALDRNRGPFEYWLRRSRSQKIGDGAVIDESIVELQGGRMPDILRRLSRAAAAFPPN